VDRRVPGRGDMQEVYISEGHDQMEIKRLIWQQGR